MRTLAALIGGCMAVAALSAQPVQDPVFVGVVRPDGLLIPIAVHDGRDWWNAWPFSREADETVTELLVPRSIDAIPADWVPPGVKIPRDWRVQSASGRTGSLRLLRPARVPDKFLISAIGIRTDYRPREDANADPAFQYEAAIAVAGPASLGRFRDVTAGTAEQLLRSIHPALLKAESDEIAFRKATDFKDRPYVFPATPAERAARPLTGTSWTQSDGPDGSTLYYFMGIKDYGAKTWPDCEVTVSFDAVVSRSRAGDITTPSVSAYTTFECSRDNTINLVFAPLGTLRLHGTVLWIVRNDAEDGYDYSLVNPAAKGDAEQINLKGLWQLRGNGNW